MKKVLFAIKDTKVGVFHDPYHYVNEAAATRSLVMAAQDVNSQLGQFPEDFELWRLGSFDVNSGALAGEPKFIFNLQNILAVKEVQNNGNQIEEKN